MADQQSELSSQWPETVVVIHHPAAVHLDLSREEIERMGRDDLINDKPFPITKAVPASFSIHDLTNQAVLAQGLTRREMIGWMNRDVAHYWVRDREADEHLDPVRWDRVDRAFWRIEGPAHPPSLVGITAQLSIPARKEVYVALLSWMGAHCQLTIRARSWPIFFEQESWFTDTLSIGGEKLTPQQFEDALERRFYVRREVR